MYVSPSTKSATVKVTPQGGTASSQTQQTNCTSTCTFQVSAPVGTDRFDVSLYNGSNGTGQVLSAGSATANIVANQTNTVSMTFDGVPASIKISIDAQPVVHSPKTLHLTVQAEDASGNVIIGPGAYPVIDVSNDDTSGTIVLGASSVSAPGTPIDVTYNGAWISAGDASAHITATIPGTGISAAFQISPQPIATAFAGVTGSPITAAIAPGPDGALWFTERYGYIGRISTTGTVTEYATPSTYEPFALAAGSDGAIWIGDGSAGASDMGRMTTGGSYSTCTGTNLEAIALVKAPDGNIWYANQSPGTVGRVTPACVQTEMGTSPAVQRMTVGPDGAVWFTQPSPGSVSYIGRITMSGTETEFPLPSTTTAATGITAGPDGYLWFTDTWTNEIGHMKTDGTMTEFPRNFAVTPGANICVGPDGAVWFTTLDGVGRISATGQMTDYPSDARMWQMVLGPDNALWGVNLSNGQIDRVSI